jgi:hypothetical protein
MDGRNPFSSRNPFSANAYLGFAEKVIEKHRSLNQ